MMETLEIVKRRLRLTSTAFDEAEITPLISAAKQDLKMSGVEIVEETDPVTLQAICLYCKAHFGDNDPDGRFQAAYVGLKNSMALCGDYHADI